ncbi:MAG: HDIG domain-containing protein [Nitrospirae bacterium]|nr:HDIG domain-containing protein [Nitrospirota bacterium]MBI5696192.1 HDIG domain-containing protein [Nitrospirota bacterium]
MASLKVERARVSVMPRKAQPKPLSIQQKTASTASGSHTRERVKKAVMGALLTVSLAFILIDPVTFTTLGASGTFESLVGLSLIVSLPLYILYWDLRRYKKAITGDLQKIALICIILLGTVAMSRFFAELFSTFTANLAGVGERTGYFGIPLAVGAMLATLLFDIHIGIVFSFIIGIFGGILVGGEPFFFIYSFVGSIIAAFSVVRCTHRSALLKAGLFVALANVATVICIDLYSHQLFVRTSLYDMVAAFTGGIFVAILVSGILPLLESSFKVVTDISLLEYSDLNSPILKTLMVTAPGTYHHSVIIGSLAEAAAEAVNVNPLMARVAAYYHDIGKIKKPEYFIENQARGENRHDRLTPSMSSLIIASHVKDGVEMAREHKVPPQIVEIIQQHHGTSLMTYFYEKAREHEDHPGLVREEDYRYPGPKPQTRVAAIVMLADSVEAASRVLDNPTPQRIAALVDKLVKRIFEDGQLSECDLTLRDLTEITKSFNLLLSGIYHHRIDYPGLGIPSGGEKKRFGGQGHKLAEEHKGGGWEPEETRGEGTITSGTGRR